MKLIRFLSCIAPALAAFAFSAAAQPQALPRRANIILIVADGLGLGDLSCYGQTQFQTPDLDKLAASGIRFTNYFAGSASSAPAHAALMLGKSTPRLAGMDFSLTSADITIAQVLKNSGYHSSLIGEWDLGDENSAGAPWRHGFDVFAGYFNPDDARNVYADYAWKYGPRFDSAHYRMETYNARETLYNNTAGQKGQYIPDSLMKWSLNIAKIYRPASFNAYRPFFLVLNETIPGNGNRQVPTDAPFSEEPWPQPEKNRAAVIARLDNDIGELLQGLNQLREASNTVIFFTSDTVPTKGDGVDPAFFHENASPDDLRVPMIVYWPGTIPAGQVSGLNCSAKDFLPTAAAIALVKPPGNIDGVSFLPVLFGQSQKIVR